MEMKRRIEIGISKEIMVRIASREKNRKDVNPTMASTVPFTTIHGPVTVKDSSDTITEVR